MTNILQWNAPAVTKATQLRVERGIERASEFVEGDTKRLLSTGQSVQRSGGRLKGRNPSPEGSPPHVLTGRLRQSITHAVEVTAQAIIGRIGTNVKYARRLELGFVGTDSRGRIIHQGERPYLRPALKNNLAKILALIARG